MNFNKLVEEVIEESNLASRISIGSDEVRNIARTGKVSSKNYKGHTFFGTKGPEEFPTSMRSFWNAYGQEGSFKPGKKAGYVLKADPSKMQTPDTNVDPELAGIKDPEWYKERGFVALPPDSEAGNIKTIQRIKQPKSSWNEPEVLGKERDFKRFMQLYNRFSRKKQ